MSNLEKFAGDERALIVALPYRIGLWVSESDDSGGPDSVLAEMHALESIITGYSEDFLKSEFVEEVMRAVLACKSEWDSWGKKLDKVPDECRQAVEILEGRLDSREVMSYKQNLMEIATSVALAYREDDGGAAAAGNGRFAACARHCWALLLARLKKEQEPRMESHINISKAERKTLTQLSDILKIDFHGAPLKDVQAA